MHPVQNYLLYQIKGRVLWKFTTPMFIHSPFSPCCMTSVWESMRTAIILSDMQSCWEEASLVCQDNRHATTGLCETRNMMIDCWMCQCSLLVLRVTKTGVEGKSDNWDSGDNCQRSDYPLNSEISCHFLMCLWDRKWKEISQMGTNITIRTRPLSLIHTITFFRSIQGGWSKKTNPEEIRRSHYMQC